MGLLVHTSFETREGIPIEDLYSRITSLVCDFRGYYVGLTITHETHLSRDKRIGGFAPVVAPTLPYRICVEVVYTELWGDMSFLYSKVKERLVEQGIACQDILEDPPQPPPPFLPPTGPPAFDVYLPVTEPPQEPTPAEPPAE